MDVHPDRIVVTRWRDGAHVRSDLVTHTEHVLGFVVDGDCVLECGCTANAAAGDLVVVPAGVPHRGHAAGATDRWTVGFCASCLGLDESQRLMAPFARVRRGGVPVAPVAPGRRRRVIRLFQDLAEEAARTAPEAPELARALLLLLLGEAVRASAETDHPVAPGSLSARALEYIQKNAIAGISLRDVARFVHRTPAHVAATVKADTGHTVGEWITAARLAEAAARLRHTDAPPPSDRRGRRLSRYDPLHPAVQEDLRDDADRLAAHPTSPVAVRSARLIKASLVAGSTVEPA